MELQLKVTSVFTRNQEALEDKGVRFIINQGGTRSSKTYSLCQLLIVYGLSNPNKIISIIRKSFPSLRSSVMRDFFEVLKELGIYSEKYHNKTEHIYTLPNGTTISFFSLDDAQKIRGRKHSVVWADEANELSFEDFNQLNFRCEEKMFFSFNPSDTQHWLYDIIERNDAIKIHSTYIHNTFLPKSLVKEIEELIKIDQDYYNIYALGLPSKSNHVIYNHHKFYTIAPPTHETILGMDFGHQHPTALVRCDYIDNQVYVRELIYESGLITSVLVERVKEQLIKEGLPLSTTIVCDYARSEIIAELNANGLNCVNAIKNVKEGIDAVKSKELYIHDDSVNLKKELNNYKWKVVNEKLTDEVVKMWDDGLDAVRYSILYYKKNFASGGGYDFYTLSF